MAYSDPQTITINSVAQVLNRSFDKSGAGKFTTADGAYTLEVLPSNGKTKVRTLRLRNSKVTSDPLVSTTNVRVTDLISVTIIQPLDGYTIDEIVKQMSGLITWLTASTNANLIKFVAGEN